MTGFVFARSQIRPKSEQTVKQHLLPDAAQTLKTTIAFPLYRFVAGQLKKSPSLSFRASRGSNKPFNPTFSSYTTLNDFSPTTASGFWYYCFPRERQLLPVNCWIATPGELVGNLNGRSSLQGPTTFHSSFKPKIGLNYNLLPHIAKSALCYFALN